MAGGSAVFQLPTEAVVRDLLSMMVGRDVAVRYEAAPGLAVTETAAVARYVDDSGAVRALAACDLVIANGLGAALALMPRGRVVEAVKSGVVPADFADNLHEVFNVGANFFNAPDRPHVRLQDVLVAPAVPADLAAQVRGATDRLDLRVDLPGYGAGIFVVVTTP